MIFLFGNWVEANETNRHTVNTRCQRSFESETLKLSFKSSACDHVSYFGHTHSWALTSSCCCFVPFTLSASTRINLHAQSYADVGPSPLVFHSSDALNHLRSHYFRLKPFCKVKYVQHCYKLQKIFPLAQWVASCLHSLILVLFKEIITTHSD